MPVAPVFGPVARHHDLVALSDADLVVAAGTPVRLFRLIGLDVAHVDRVVGLGPAVRVHGAVTVPPWGRVAALQVAGSLEREPLRASSTFARSGSRTRRSQAPCHSQAAVQTGHDSTTEPPDQASASIGVWS